MLSLQVGDRTIDLDDDGYMRESELWNDEVAAALAAGLGISELTAEHWKIVRYLRQHYLDHGLPPLVRKLCKQTGVKLKRIFELFPGGPAKGACKVAGLPNGDGCV